MRLKVFISKRKPIQHINETYWDSLRVVKAYILQGKRKVGMVKGFCSWDYEQDDDPYFNDFQALCRGARAEFLYKNKNKKPVKIERCYK